MRERKREEIEIERDVYNMYFTCNNNTHVHVHVVPYCKRLVVKEREQVKVVALFSDKS